VYAPDGKYILGAEQGHWIRRWDADANYEMKGAFGLPDECCALAITANGRYWLSAGESTHCVFIWDVAKRQIIGRFVGHTGPVKFVAATPDSRRAVSGDCDGIRVWDIASCRTELTLPQHGLACAIAPDGRWVLTMDNDKAARFWDLNTGVKLHEIKIPDHDPVALSPNGEYVLFRREGFGVNAMVKVPSRLRPEPGIGNVRRDPQMGAGQPSATAKQNGKVTYLSDMNEYGVISAEGRFGKHGNLGYEAGRPASPRISVRGKHYPHGLSVCPFTNGYARVMYELDGKAHRFETSVALNDSACAPGQLSGGYRRTLRLR
jgi:hypothetical protein